MIQVMTLILKTQVHDFPVFLIMSKDSVTRVTITLHIESGCGMMHEGLPICNFWHSNKISFA